MVILNVIHHPEKEFLVKDSTIDVSDLTSGTYIIRVNANGVYHDLQLVKE